ncbi:hypothetical protein CHELA1G11_10901 [Hyphomicrobiales bacterium]|nr:hypothetical protein CHELA1G11_10901 [Hyphomicrobiales bacterium]CAH1671526.1 hypothetical protein CHELA1G2_13408 [Hyphomicrobiales bacterium]
MVSGAAGRAKASEEEFDRRGRGHDFPPASTSLEPFLQHGSDDEFRAMIYNFIAFSTMMLQAREAFAERIGVSAPQYSIIVAIGEAGRTTVGGIAERLHVSSPFVTAEVGKLIKRGIVERHPNGEDRRSSWLVLSKAGIDLVRQVAPLRRATNDTIFGSLDPKQAADLRNLIATLVQDGRKALYQVKFQDPHRAD